MNKKNQKGFTLVELIVVIAIVAILASVAIVGYTQFIKNARESKAKAELDQIYNVMYSDAVGLGIDIAVYAFTEENGVKTQGAKVGTVTLKVNNQSKIEFDISPETEEGTVTVEQVTWALELQYLSGELEKSSLTLTNDYMKLTYKNSDNVDGITKDLGGLVD